MAGLNYISIEAHKKEVDSLLDTIEKLGMLAAERKKEIKRLNTRIIQFAYKLEEVQEELDELQAELEELQEELEKLQEEQK